MLVHLLESAQRSWPRTSSVADNTSLFMIIPVNINILEGTGLHALYVSCGSCETACQEWSCLSCLFRGLWNFQAGKAHIKRFAKSSTNSISSRRQDACGFLYLKRKKDHSTAPHQLRGATHIISRCCNQKRIKSPLVNSGASLWPRGA